MNVFHEQRYSSQFTRYSEELKLKNEYFSRLQAENVRTGIYRKVSDNVWSKIDNTRQNCSTDNLLKSFSKSTRRFKFENFNFKRWSRSTEFAVGKSRSYNNREIRCLLRFRSHNQFSHHKTLTNIWGSEVMLAKRATSAINP